MKQELGRIQTNWVESLEANPEQQITGCLGKEIEAGRFGYCCLGKGLEVLGKATIEDGVVLDILDGGNDYDKCSGILQYHYQDLGLRNAQGKSLIPFGKNYITLSEANDGDMTWTEIAAAIRADPDNFFTKSL